MNKKQALERSIEKWLMIVAGVPAKVYCPLCDKYYENYCAGCPVKEKVGVFGCQGTPFEEWVWHHCEKHPQKSIMTTHCKECTQLATKELLFLASLREE